MLNFIFGILNKAKTENKESNIVVPEKDIMEINDIKPEIAKSNNTESEQDKKNIFIKKINKIKNKIEPKYVVSSYNWYPLEEYIKNYSKEYIAELMINERMEIFQKYPVLNGFKDYPQEVLDINRYAVQFENKYPEYKFIPGIPL